MVVFHLRKQDMPEKTKRWFLPLGMADTKRFFHQGLLRSDFSSSLSFLSSTYRQNHQDTFSYKQVDHYTWPVELNAGRDSSPLLSESPCLEMMMVLRQRLLQGHALQPPPVGWGQDHLWAGGLDTQCQSYGCGPACLERSGAAWCAPAPPGPGSGAWRESGASPDPGHWLQGWGGQEEGGSVWCSAPWVSL